MTNRMSARPAITTAPRRRGCQLWLVFVSASLLLLSTPAQTSPVGSATTRQLAATTTTASAQPVAAECVVGNRTFSSGAEVPGAGRKPCERCACADGKLACALAACEARPGCKALHRPDECCPTFQCECEQNGHVYGNGEKLVDPTDPCKVCYCQGGEVVCRRIACFLRSDCQPKLVPGRCCPQYDNCPLRGGGTESGVASTLTSSFVDSVTQKSLKLEDNVKKEITIKEVTPVSEIPTIVSGIRIKEVVPSVEVSPSADATQLVATSSAAVPGENQHLTTQTKQEKLSSHEEQLTSKTEIVRTTTKIPTTSTSTPVSTTTTHVILASSTIGTSVSLPAEDEDLPPELVNPAFPPLPDDLSEPTRDDSDPSYPHSSLEPVTATDLQIGGITSTQHITATTKSAPITINSEALTTADTLSEVAVKSTLETVTTFETTGTQSTYSSTTEAPISPSEVYSIQKEENLGIKTSKFETESLERDSPTTAATISSLMTHTIADQTKPTENSSKILTLETVRRDSGHTTVETKKTPLSTEKPLSSSGENTILTPASTSAPISISSQTIVTLSPAPETSTSPKSFTQSSLASTVISSTTTVREIVPIVKDAPPKFAKKSTSTSSSSPVPPLIDSATKEYSIFSTFTPVTFMESSTFAMEAASSSIDTKELIKNSESLPVIASGIKSDDERRSGALVATSAPANSNNALSDLIKLVGDVASIGERAPDSTIEISEDDAAPVSDLAPPADRAEPLTKRPIIDREPSPPSSVATFEHRDIEIINKAYVPSIRRPGPTKLLNQAPTETPNASE